MRSLAFDFEIDQQTFARLGEDGVADKVFDEAVKFYHRKRQSLAAPFRDGIRRMAEGDQENKPERGCVDFSDGRRARRARVRVEAALAPDGRATTHATQQS